MIYSELSIRIARPLPDVYRFLMDASQYTRWQSGLLEVSASDGMNAGSIITFTILGLGTQITLTGNVTENNGTTSFQVISKRGPVTFSSSFYLAPAGGETIVKLANKINAGTTFKLAEPALQSISDNRYEADLHTLKAILESPAV